MAGKASVQYTIVDLNDAIRVQLLNENQSVAVTSGRLASAAQTFTIPFAAYLGPE